jgi:hypothetical protein
MDHIQIYSMHTGFHLAKHCHHPCHRHHCHHVLRICAEKGLLIWIHSSATHLALNIQGFLIFLFSSPPGAAMKLQ